MYSWKENKMYKNMYEILNDNIVGDFKLEKFTI